MSSDTSPIEPAEFARALEALPTDALHQKAAETLNSVRHLRSSNEQMLPFADAGDDECREAMYENLIVIGRMNVRIKILREEVERRGLRWVEDREGRTDGDGGGVGGAEAGQNGTGAGSLTDEQLRARLLEERLEEQEREEESGGEAGVHL